MKEINRQYVHIITALMIIGFILIFGRMKTIGLLFFGLIIGSYIINLKVRNKKIPIVDWIVEKFERDETRFVGYGSAWFVIGCLISLTFLSDTNQIISIIWILGVGDGLSTIFGINGKKRLFYNEKKTLEGTVAFFLSSVPTYFLIGPFAIALSICLAIVESLPAWIDDNAAIPIVGTIIISILM